MGASAGNSLTHWKNKYAWNSATTCYKGSAVVNEVVCDFVFIVKFVVAFFSLSHAVRKISHQMFYYCLEKPLKSQIIQVYVQNNKYVRKFWSMLFILELIVNHNY
jgi:hypothetical protein